MKFGIIAATDDKHGLGKGGLIPWYYPEDFKHFQKTTEGSTCFMGRKTYDEIAGMRKGKKELLPKRKCVVFSTTPLVDDRVTVCSDMTKYLEHATETNFFIGGRFIFDFAMDIADEVIITAIPGNHDCDVFFPHEKLEAFEVVEERILTADLCILYFKRK